MEARYNTKEEEDNDEEVKEQRLMRQDQFRIKKLREREAKKRTMIVAGKKSPMKLEMKKLNSCDANTIKARKLNKNKKLTGGSPPISQLK